MNVAIIGGGIAGLVAAHELSKSGAGVTLLERAPRLGGLAGSFAVAPGQEIEKYYHFLCKGDTAYFALLDELGLRSRLRWVTTDMGFFYDGRLYPFGDPLSLLAFPHLSVSDKARFAWTTLKARRRGASDWRDIEDETARDWLIAHYGRHTYEVLYRTLLQSKFGEHAGAISAAWMWARFHRLGNSRTATQRERVGYLEGGSQAYIDALEGAIRSRGVTVRTSARVEKVLACRGRVTGLRCGGEDLPFDAVISTVPVPHTRALFADLEGPYFDNLRALPYIGVLVMLLRLDRRFSRYYWTNVSDARVGIAGVIEYTNLNPYPALGGDSLVYIPQYLPQTDPLFALPDADLLDRYCGYLKLINPAFDRAWVKGSWVHRDRFAQPICETGFSRRIPAIQTPIDNLLLTDSYQLHPHDRAITFSTELGLQAARRALGKTGRPRPDAALADEAVSTARPEGHTLR